MENWIELPTGTRIYWTDNEAGGRTYYSDSCGIVAEIWDTSIASQTELLYAMEQEAKLRKIEKPKQPQIQELKNDELPEAVRPIRLENKVCWFWHSWDKLPNTYKVGMVRRCIDCGTEQILIMDGYYGYSKLLWRYTGKRS